MSDKQDKHEHTHEHEDGFRHHDHEAMSTRPCDGEGHEHHHHEDGSCCCAYHSTQFHGLSRGMLLRLLISAALFAAGLILGGGHHHGEGGHRSGAAGVPLLMIASAVIAGYDIVWKALKNLWQKRRFDEYFLMTFAAFVACWLGEYQEAAAVMVLYRIGAYCQNYAIRHSQRRLEELSGGQEHERSALSGEKEEAMTVFARIYTPVILFLALMTAVIMPQLSDLSLRESAYRALSFLVLACPCAVVISVPLTYSLGVAGAARKGIYFTDSGAVDRLAAGVDAAGQFHTRQHKGRDYQYHDDGGVVVDSGRGGTPTAALTRARRTRRIARENMLIMTVIKAAVLVLSVSGEAPLWLAVFADSGVTILCVLNALRAMM